MKIVIQNGNNVGKQELELFVARIPISWRKLFSTVVIYGSREETMKVTRHEKEGVLEIHCAAKYIGSLSCWKKKWSPAVSINMC